jgi:hypothetical protein
MTVDELITQLSTLNGYLPVTLVVGGNGAICSSSLQTVKLDIRTGRVVLACE